MSLSEIDTLLKDVHERIGKPPGGLIVYTNPGEVRLPIRIQWRRSYDGVLSDERDIEATDLVTGLKSIIVYEDDVDASEGPPTYDVTVNLGDDESVRRYLVSASDQQAAEDIVREVAESLIDVHSTRVGNPEDQDETEYDGVFREGES